MRIARAGMLGVAVILALCCAGAPSAMAEEAGWVVNQTEYDDSGETAALATTAQVVENPKLTAGGVTVECTGLNSTSPEIVGPNVLKAQSLVFSGCSASGVCSLATKTIGSVPVRAEIQTLAGTKESEAIFLPQTKTTFATIKYEGTECALAGVQPLTGKTTLLAPSGQTESTLQELAANGASGELKLGSNTATLKGKVKIQQAAGQRMAMERPILALRAPWAFGPVEVNKEIKLGVKYRARKEIEMETLTIAGGEEIFKRAVGGTCKAAAVVAVEDECEAINIFAPLNKVGYFTQFIIVYRVLSNMEQRRNTAEMTGIGT